MSSPVKEVWGGIRALLIADTSLMAMVNGVYDKRTKDEVAFAEPKLACISRGPVSGVDDSSHCLMGAEITFQLDVWSRQPNRWTCDDMVHRMRKALHGQSLNIVSGALVEMSVDMWRVLDDPDGLTTHGVVHVVAIIEEAA